MIDDDDAGRFVLGHRRALDGFRGVAVILVLLVHFEFIWPQVGLRWFPGGFIGVDLFFALSGFLLTSLLLQERRERGRFSFGAFYRRRAYRLLPALFFVMGCNIIYVQIVGLSLRPQLVANLYMVSYVANWALVFSGPFALTFAWGPAWSLSVEEQYYLVFFPLLVLALRHTRSLRPIMWGLAIGIAFGAAWRALVFAHTSAGRFAMVYVRTDTRVDALLVGPLAALALHQGLRVGRGIRLLAIAGTAYLIWFVKVASLDSPWVYQFGFLLADLSAAAILLAILDAQDPATRFLRTRPMGWIGKVSYGLYLWNLPVFLATARALRGESAAVRTVVALVLTFACTSISYYVVERPFLRLKRRNELIASPAAD